MINKLRIEDITELEKHPCGTYVGISPQSAIDEFRQDEKKKGDVISFGARRIIEDDDKSPFAYDSLVIYADLLQEGMRWPDELDHPHDAKSRFLYWRSKRRYDQGKANWRLYRPQHILTRDPVYMVGALAVHLNRWQFIDDLPIPWHVWRFKMWVWKRGLMATGKVGLSPYILKQVKTAKRWRIVYEWLELSMIWLPTDDYVKLLVYYRAKAIGSPKVLRIIRERWSS